MLVLSDKDPAESKPNTPMQALRELMRICKEVEKKVQQEEATERSGAPAQSENTEKNKKKQKKTEEASKPQVAIFAFRNIGRVIEYAAVLPTNLRIDSTLYRMEDGTCSCLCTKRRRFL